MAWNRAKLQAFSNRRSERMSRHGRLLEEVVLLLAKMQEQGKIASFIRHPANSIEDSDGKDFTVTVMQNGQASTCSFGVTISPRRWRDGKMKHPHVPQFCWPIGTNRDTMEKRILELFP